LLFLTYINGIGKIISQQPTIKYKLYADDILLFLTCAPNDVHNAITTIEQCVKSVSTWLAQNSLFLNATKTDFLIIGSKVKLKKSGKNYLTVNGLKIEARESVRYLGVELDKTLSMDKQIGKVCGSAFGNLRLLYRFHMSMSRRTRLITANALIFSHLNFCNSLYFGLPKKQLKRLQRVLSATRRFIGISTSENMKADCNDIWTTIEVQIQLKILVITFMAQTGKAPPFISDMLIKSSMQNHNLRSNHHHFLVVPRTHQTCGDRAFSVVAPKLFNHLLYENRCAPSLRKFRTGVQRLLAEGPIAL
jgi:hypothetical protein